MVGKEDYRERLLINDLRRRMHETNLLTLFYPAFDDVRRQIVCDDFLLVGNRPGRASGDEPYVWAKEGFLRLSGGRGHGGVCGGAADTATSESGV